MQSPARPRRRRLSRREGPCSPEFDVGVEQVVVTQTLQGGSRHAGTQLEVHVPRSGLLAHGIDSSQVLDAVRQRAHQFDDVQGKVYNIAVVS